MQPFLIKLLRARWHIVDILNNKFDKLLSILSSLFDHLKVQAPIVEAYDALSKKINMSFQRVIECLYEVQANSRLASDAGTSKEIAGEGPSHKVEPFNGNLPRSSLSEMNLMMKT